MKIVCDGGVEGKWYTLDAPDSLDDEYSLPGKSYVEGRMKFSVPPGCVNGKLNAEFTGMSIGKEPPDAQWRLP